MVQVPIGDFMTIDAMPEQDLARTAPPRVLVVEDEFLIRLHVAEHLRDSGFTVFEACSGDEALVMLKAGAILDLVYTDVRMPGQTDGMDLLGYVRMTQPDVPVVVTSGHLQAARAYAAGAGGFVPKPCSPEVIVTVLEATLGAR